MHDTADVIVTWAEKVVNRGERIGQFKFLALFVRLNKKKLKYNYCQII